MGHRITCISRGDGGEPFDRITHIGGTTGANGGRPWKVTLQEAIDGIESGRWSFFVNREGAAANVFVAVGPAGDKYLAAEVDGGEPGDLLSLPACE